MTNFNLSLTEVPPGLPGYELITDTAVVPTGGALASPEFNPPAGKVIIWLTWWTAETDMPNLHHHGINRDGPFHVVPYFTNSGPTDITVDIAFVVVDRSS